MHLDFWHPGSMLDNRRGAVITVLTQASALDRRPYRLRGVPVAQPSLTFSRSPGL